MSYESFFSLIIQGYVHISGPDQSTCRLSGPGDAEMLILYRPGARTLVACFTVLGFCPQVNQHQATSAGSYESFMLKFKSIVYLYKILPSSGDSEIAKNHVQVLDFQNSR